LGQLKNADPNALIFYAGPSVIEQTVGQVLPEGYQRSEFLLAHGAIDMVLDRRTLKDEISSILSILANHSYIGRS
jgi:acetyl-CoA carboxylase carboxyl transferase subunit beta